MKKTELEAVGDIDEVVALISRLLALKPLALSFEVVDTLNMVMQDLGAIMSVLTNVIPKEYFDGRLDVLLEKCDRFKPEGVFKFVDFSKGRWLSAEFNVLRTVIRRAERHTLQTLEYQPINEYLNKLSTLMFNLSIWCAR